MLTTCKGKVPIQRISCVTHESGLSWSPLPDSNRWPSVYKTDALASWAKEATSSSVQQTHRYANSKVDVMKVYRVHCFYMCLLKRYFPVSLYFLSLLDFELYSYGSENVRRSMNLNRDALSCRIMHWNLRLLCQYPLRLKHDRKRICPQA